MADQDYIVETGVIVPDTADLLADVSAEWRAAFGQDLAVTPDTPQGVMIAAEVAARSETLALLAALANQINPELAGGVFLDALCALLGLTRAEATRTLVPAVELNGQPLTLIPAGVRARTASGDLFESVGAVTLDSLGAAVVDFQSVEFGPIQCGAATLTTVVDSVLGWETVTNPNAGIPGTAQQSDESLRDERRRTLARQGISTVEAQVSDLNALPGVRSIQFRENTAATTEVIDGITMAPHSIWACVYGGEDDEIAESLLRNKTDGAGYNGAVTVNVVEPYSGQTYPVKFDRPTAVPMLARVTVRQGESVVDPQTAVRDAVVAYADGELPGERGFVVGGGISPFEIAAGVNAQVPGIFIVKVEVAPVSTGVYQTVEYPIAINEVGTIMLGSVTVVEV